MIIALPYREEPLSEIELKFALRSITKYLTGFTNLIIIGTPPAWYKGEHIEAVDYPGRKQYTIFSKLLLPCDLCGNFILWNDDHYLLRPLHVDNIYPFTSGTMKEAIDKSQGRYLEALHNTAKIVGYDSPYYDIHTPCLFNSDNFKGLKAVDWKDEYVIKSLYFNMFKSGSVYMSDCKIKDLITKEGILHRIDDRLFFSTGANGVKRPMIELLNELYPNKSEWEK